MMNRDRRHSQKNVRSTQQVKQSMDYQKVKKEKGKEKARQQLTRKGEE